MINIDSFWRYYDEYVATGFSDKSLAVLLADLMHSDALNLPENRPDKGWEKSLGFISLIRGKLMFGWVHEDHVLILDTTKGEYCLASYNPEVFVHPRDMYGGKTSFGMWLPLYTVEHVKAAIRVRSIAPSGLFYREWLEKNEVTERRVLVPR